MKNILFVLSAAVLVSCGEKNADEVKLETFDQKIAFSLGSLRAKDLMSTKEVDVSKLEKEQLMDGFRNGYVAAAQPECGKTIEGLLGADGKEFNETFVTEASNCIGQFVSFDLYSLLLSVDKNEEIDTTLLFRGFYEGLFGTDTLSLSSDEQKDINKEFGEGIQAKMDAKMQQQYGANLSIGETFLAANTTKPGVITTASGLQYEVLEKGSGAKPGPADNVVCHYHGTLIDGTVFESTVESGAPPIEFNVQGVIRGWTEGLQLMSKGAKYKFYIPQELAYGATPRPGPIQPYAALIFEIELVDIK